MQATCGIPEVAFTTFENMEYGGEGITSVKTYLYLYHSCSSTLAIRLFLVKFVE